MFTGAEKETDQRSQCSSSNPGPVRPTQRRGRIQREGCVQADQGIPHRPPCEQKAAIDAITELLTAHYSEAVDSADEDGKFGIGFKVTFDRSHSPTKLKVTSRISKSLTDEIETSVPDPNQPELL
ncbi:MAG: hypothetical protein ACOYM3_34700 [Terrimicrobiaceae bacterium]